MEHSSATSSPGSPSCSAVLDSERPRLKKALAGNHAAMVQPIFFSAIYTSALSIPSMLFLLVVDTKPFAGAWMQAVVLMVLAMAVLRTARLVWLLRMLVLIATRGSPPT